MDTILMDRLLWAMQYFLAVSFLIAGAAKLFQSPAQVAKLVPGGYPLPFLRMLGAIEIVGAAGIVLPLLLNVLPVLTPLTAGCMVVVLLAAAMVHLKAKQYSRMPMLLVLLALAVFVAVGRSNFQA